MAARIPVAVVGATGLAGQQFLAALEDHPLFELKALAASARSAGKRYQEAIRDESGASRWFADAPLPGNFAKMLVQDGASFDPTSVALVFSAVDGETARLLEAKYAETTPVVSTASAYRYEDDVPLIIPPVNPDHVELLEVQQRKRGWKGFVAPIPNCTTTGLAVTLAPLSRAFGIELVVMTSLQATSGAGRTPGVAALDVIDNVIPYIPNEEEKVEREARKILGALVDGRVEPHSMSVTATCMRVGVVDGHTESVFVRLGASADQRAVVEAFRAFEPPSDVQGLPTAPERWIEVSDDPFRPQPRLDREAGGGMVTSVGRVREDRSLGLGTKYVLVSHNTKMGAAKGAILLAELLHRKGKLQAV